MRVTINKVNEALRRLPGAGDDAEIVKGNGYWWFAGHTAAGFYSQSVYTMNLNDLTLEEWVAEYKSKQEAGR